MFKNLSDKPVAELQLEQADKWDETGLLRKTIEARNGQPTYVFYEGPPTANGKPGIHHELFAEAGLPDSGAYPWLKDQAICGIPGQSGCAGFREQTRE